MGDCIIARQFDHAFVARQHAVCGQREGLEDRFRPEPREDRRGGAALVVAALRADMVQLAGIGNFDFHHLVEARRSRTVLEDRHLGPGIDLDDVVQDRV